MYVDQHLNSLQSHKALGSDNIASYLPPMLLKIASSETSLILALSQQYLMHLYTARSISNYREANVVPFFKKDSRYSLPTIDPFPSQVLFAKY